jgi:hypothetical protein
MDSFTITVDPADHERLATAIEKHSKACAKLHKNRRSGAAVNSDKTKIAWTVNTDTGEVEFIVLDAAGKTTPQIKELAENRVAELLNAA